MKFHLLGLLAFFISGTSFAQKLNKNWNADLNSSLEEFKNCGDENNSVSCRQFPGKSLNMVYNLNDFYVNDDSRYMSVNEISTFLKSNTKWTLLGHAYEPNTLAEAQKLANDNKAALAIYTNDSGEGHMVLIVPGELQPSGSWGLNVPNSVSFFPSDPSKSYVSKGLSYAFGKSLIKDVLVYRRNY